MHALADDRVRFLGGVWDQEQLDQLYANCYTYLHGHSVGGTNPSLLRAIGAGAAVVAYDVDFNREVVADAGRYFGEPRRRRRAGRGRRGRPGRACARGRRARELAGRYDWDDVAAGYEELAPRLAARQFPQPPAERPADGRPERRPRRRAGSATGRAATELCRPGRRRRSSPPGGAAVTAGPRRARRASARRPRATTLRRLSGAQKGAVGAPAYSRFVNRRLGRRPRRAGLPRRPDPERRHRHQRRLHRAGIALLALRPAVAGASGWRSPAAWSLGLRARRRGRPARPAARRRLAGRGVARPHGGRREGLQPAPGRARRRSTASRSSSRVAAAGPAGLLRRRRGHCSSPRC